MLWFRDPFDDFYGDFYDGYGVNRRGFAPVSERASRARAEAEKIFLEYLVMADTSKGDATEEIIQFHMVPDMRKAFSKFAKEHKCKAISRQLTRAEQDKISPGRKSLMWYTSATVTAAAQKEYLEKNPGKFAEIKKKKDAAAAALAAKNANAKASQAVPARTQPVAGGSGSKKRSATEANFQPQASTSANKKVKV